MNNSSKSDSGKEDKRTNKNAIKLKTNDEAWGAPTVKPVILISDKVERFFEQRMPNEL